MHYRGNRGRRRRLRTRKHRLLGRLDAFEYRDVSFIREENAQGLILSFTCIMLSQEIPERACRSSYIGVMGRVKIGYTLSPDFLSEFILTDFDIFSAAEPFLDE